MLNPKLYFRVKHFPQNRVQAVWLWAKAAPNGFVKEAQACCAMGTIRRWLRDGGRRGE